MTHRKLFTPGPTVVPPQVLETMARPLGHHRTPEFRAIHRETVTNLQYIYRTQNPVVILTASGTAALEAALVNLTRPGEKVLVTVLGKFSERWKDLGEAYGLDLVLVEAEWGDPVTPDQIEAAFKENPGITTLFTTHSETSTGVLQDVAAMARIAHDHGALIVVDGITSIGSEDVQTDKWRLDIVVGGSQKGVMVPPGLSFLSVSPAARERMERARHPVFYLDLRKALTSLEKDDTPWTPAMTLIIALNEAVGMMKAEGIENVVARHARNAAGVRTAVTAMGIPLLASVPANCTTAIVPKEGTADSIRKRLDEAYGIKVAGGQGKLKGKIVRLGHLGYYFENDMYTLISSLEAAMSGLGLIDDVGQGVRALLQHYRQK